MVWHHTKKHFDIATEIEQMKSYHEHPDLGLVHK
jgi:hypothetical protein